jgi:hypothetical protein
LQGWDLPEAFQHLRHLLEARMGNRGKREFIQVLRLLEALPRDIVTFAVDVEKAVTALAVGEALVSFLDRSAVPVPVEHVKVSRPVTSMAPISDIEREAVMLADPMRHRYTGDDAEMRQAFTRRWQAERGLPALPEAA